MIRHKLKYLRNKKELNQVEVSQKTGIAYRTYTRLERGEIIMTIPHALKLMKLFNVSHMEDLLEDEELRDS